MSLRNAKAPARYLRCDRDDNVRFMGVANRAETATALILEPHPTLDGTRARDPLNNEEFFRASSNANASGMHINNLIVSNAFQTSTGVTTLTTTQFRPGGLLAITSVGANEVHTMPTIAQMIADFDLAVGDAFDVTVTVTGNSARLTVPAGDVGNWQQPASATDIFGVTNDFHQLAINEVAYLKLFLKSATVIGGYAIRDGTPANLEISNV